MLWCALIGTKSPPTRSKRIANREFDWSEGLLNLAGSKKEREPWQPAEEKLVTSKRAPFQSNSGP